MMLVRGVQDKEGVDEQYFPPSEDLGGLDLGNHTETQQLQVRSICISEIFQETLGKTCIVEHDIAVRNDASEGRLYNKIPESIRFCIDFRYLNSISQSDSYPTPRIDDLLERQNT